jgi:hypothetical protein
LMQWEEADVDDVERTIPEQASQDKPVEFVPTYLDTQRYSVRSGRGQLYVHADNPCSDNCQPHRNDLKVRLGLRGDGVNTHCRARASAQSDSVRRVQFTDSQFSVSLLASTRPQPAKAVHARAACALLSGLLPCQLMIALIHARCASA